MVCKTPDLRDVKFENGMSLDFGFIMGNVTKLLRLQKPGSRIRRPLVYYPLPSIKPLPGSIYYHKDLIVNLEVSNQFSFSFFKNTIFVLSHNVLRKPRKDLINCRLCEHGYYIYLTLY